MGNEADVTIINIEPSDNLFRELGNNTYDFNDLVSEFIDNSIAGSNEYEKVKVYIDSKLPLPVSAILPGHRHAKSIMRL